MKLIYVLFFCAATVCSAQTFVNYKITNFDTNGIGSLTFNVPTNVLFKVKSFSYVTKGYAVANDISAVYPESTNSVYFPTENPMILGPAAVTVQAFIELSYGQTLSFQALAVMLGEFDVVNTTACGPSFAPRARRGRRMSRDIRSSVTIWRGSNRRLKPRSRPVTLSRFCSTTIEKS